MLLLLLLLLVCVCSTHTRNTFIVLIHPCLFLFKLTLTLLAVFAQQRTNNKTNTMRTKNKTNVFFLFFLHTLRPRQFRRIHLSELPVHLLLLFNCFYLSVQMSNVIYTLYVRSLSSSAAADSLMKLRYVKKYFLS